MKIKALFIIIGIFIGFISFGQQKKVYYDSEWMVCNKSEAQFFRLITFDNDNNPIGLVKDYYISGELQWAGYLSYMDDIDNSKDVMDGKCIWYYKNGNKQRESTIQNNIENGLSTYWLEDGKIEFEVYYNQGSIDYSTAYYYYDTGVLQAKIGVLDDQRHGPCDFFDESGTKTTTEYYNYGVIDGLVIWYDKSGDLSSIKEFDNGKATDKFYISFDNYTKSAEKVFAENFTTKNENGWIEYNESSVYSKYIQGKGIEFNVKNKNGYRTTVDLNLNRFNAYVIKGRVKHLSGVKNNGYGLVWGLKDWDNYNYFMITQNGYFKVGHVWDGINSSNDYTYSKYIYSGSNDLTIKKIGDELYYAINGKVVYSSSPYMLHGSEVGFINYGSKKILIEELEVNQEFTKEDFDKLLAKHFGESEGPSNNGGSSGWLGNGTGFFIDASGYIATNYHVIEDSKEIEVEFIRNGEKQIFSAEIIMSDVQNDLSIIRISDPNFKSFKNLPYNFKTNISDVGTNVFALGYPMALSLMGTEIKFTDGKISSKTGLRGDITTYQISAPIQPGNSGGPLFDFEGNIIGITSSTVNRKLDITENVNYAIKSSYLQNLVDVLDVSLSLPTDNSISSKTLTEKIQVLSDYVVLIKVK